MIAPENIRVLVDRFGTNLDQLRSAAYNETQIRREYLDPLFMALGWDVDNRQGFALPYREVIHEDSIIVAGGTKAPDYSFRVGGVRKFFVEAKKPSVNLKEDAHPAFQLRRYAWSANLPLSILTDFEEFAVYDCHTRPTKLDKASNSRVSFFTFKDYLHKWEEIHSVFSKEAVLRGSFDKYAETKKGKRGTADVDDVFLEEIEIWRSLLARNIALRNPKLSQVELNFAVQRTVDRIIFLRICEDRGIETYGTLQDLASGERAYKRLVDLFHQADDKYNSGLFHFRPEKDRSESPDGFTLDLKIDDKVVKDIIGGLYYPESPYEFSVLPADILGSVYERFLGKVIRLTKGHQAKIEEKPEVRKAGGVYYTPKYIVDYIVKNTVGKLVEGNTPKDVSAIRVLDPACGSGSFLIGAYQFLLDWHRDWYAAHEPEKLATTKKAAVYVAPGGEWKLTTTERKRILLNNIYGVDIDTQAVEVTKLSLLLKVLEGENEQTINAQLTMFHERALPDLGNNIKCGNSLIAPDFFDGQLIVGSEERMTVNPFDWQIEFKGIMERGGFDAVVGNPPYVRIQRVDHSQADYLFRVYKTASSKTDLSTVFIDKALSLSSSRGRVGFISTSQWMSTDYGKGLRGLLADRRINEIVDFGSLPVFEGAQTYPGIFILSPIPIYETFALKRIGNTSELCLSGLDSARTVTIVADVLKADSWNLGLFNLETHLHEHGISFRLLSEVGDAMIGALTGMDEVFVVTKDKVSQEGLEQQLLLPYAYRGAEVRAYEMVDPQARIIYPYEEGPDGGAVLIPEKELRTHFPKIHAHLLAFKDALSKRMDSRRLYAEGRDWYRYLRPGRYEYIRPSKLVIKGIDTKATVGFLGKNVAFNGANCPAIILKDGAEISAEFLAGILNSSLATYFFRQICPPKLGGYLRFNANSVNRMPIPAIDISDASKRTSFQQIQEVVKSRVALGRKATNARTDHERTALQRQIDTTDKQIDALVYELYGLTEEEIRIVEGGRA